MAKLVEYSCEKCNHSKTASTKYLIGYFFTILFVSLGVLFISLVLIAGPKSIFNIFATGIMTYEARTNQEDFRSLAINLTDACRGDPSNLECLEWALFYSLNDIRYVPDSLIKHERFDPSRVIEQGSDCKYMASLYTGLARSIGIDARIECSSQHCVSSIPLGNGSRTIVDLTYPHSYVVHQGEEWNAIYELETEEYWSRMKYI